MVHSISEAKNMALKAKMIIQKHFSSASIFDSMQRNCDESNRFNADKGKTSRNNS